MEEDFTVMAGDRRNWWFDWSSHDWVCTVTNIQDPGEKREAHRIPDEDINALLKHIAENNPEKITLFRGRDKDDIALLNRMTDIIELFAKKVCSHKTE